MKRILHTAAVFAALALAAPAQALEWEASAGLGYDSNVYRAPDGTYDDYADLVNCSPPTPGCNTVNPSTESGLFVPLELNGTTPHQSGMVLGLDFSGDVYLDGAQSNANQYKLELTAGRERVLAEVGNRRDTSNIVFNLTRKVKTFYDRDTGVDKNAADRYSYFGLGVDGELDRRTGDFMYGVDGTLEYRDYDAVPGTDYDRTIVGAGGYAGWRLSNATMLKLDGDVTMNAYSERRARLLTDGQLSGTTMDDLYVTVEATVRQRLSPNWVGYLDYRIRTRDDGFEGYDNYTSNRVKGRLIRKVGNTRLRLAADHEIRSYDNAFAFNNNAMPGLDYNITNAEAKLELERGNGRTWWSVVDYRNVDTNDTRYAYTRTQVTAGMAWQF